MHPSVRKVACVRLSRERTVEEHLACPYCFGRAPDVERGERAGFCGYEAGVDPVSFGFPEVTSRRSA